MYTSTLKFTNTIIRLQTRSESRGNGHSKTLLPLSPSHIEMHTFICQNGTTTKLLQLQKVGRGGFTAAAVTDVCHVKVSLQWREGEGRQD